MKTLSRANTFQKSIISYMNQLNLQQNDINELRKQFEAIDSNNDGTLSTDEIRDIMALYMNSED